MYCSYATADLTLNYEGKSLEEAKEQYGKDIHTGATKFDYQVCFALHLARGAPDP